MKKLMTAQEAAKELGVNDSRVRQLARDGALQGIRIGRDWVFEPEAVTKHKEERKQANAGKAGRPFKV